MGASREIRFDPAVAADWPAIRARLASVGEAPVLRMIDGLPAFPDEVPDPRWGELRLGLAGGMVTLRRDPGVLTCLVWGNADPALLLARDRLGWRPKVALPQLMALMVDADLARYRGFAGKSRWRTP